MPQAHALKLFKNLAIITAHTSRLALPAPKVLFGEVQTLRVLVIEDDALLALTLAEVLSDLGHAVCATAATPAAAIAAAYEQRPDFLLSDVKLHNGSGIDAVEEILRSRPVPHMFMTGDLVGLHLRLPDAVAIRKPFSSATLAKAMAKALKAEAAP
jgi:CheY-like chemotaxis protein